MKRANFLKSIGGLSILTFLPQPSYASTMSYLDKLKSKIIRKDEGEVLNVIGDIQTHKLVGSETDNQIVECLCALSILSYQHGLCLLVFLNCKKSFICVLKNS